MFLSFGKYFNWLQDLLNTTWLPVFVGSTCLLFGIATYFTISGEWFQGKYHSFEYILYLIDLMLILFLVILIVFKVIRIVVDFRFKKPGARLHSRIALLFGMISVVPIVLVAIFSTLFFNLGIQSWFSSRVLTALEQSQDVAAAYKQEHMEIVRYDATQIMYFISWLKLTSISTEQELTSFLGAQIGLRSLSEAVFFKSNGDIIAKAGLSHSILIDLPDIIRNHLSYVQDGSVKIIENDRGDKVRALTIVDFEREIYLIIGRLVDPKVITYANRVNEATEQYFKLEGKREDFERTFAVYYLGVALVLLLLALWLGLLVANRLIWPISALVGAVEKVGSEGQDLNIQVANVLDSEEMSILIQAFNRMTKRLDLQKKELLRVNDSLDQRRRFSEALLDSAIVGIMVIDHDNLISISNRTAVRLLSGGGKEIGGSDLAHVAPELMDLVQESRYKTGQTVQSQLEVLVGFKKRTFSINMFGEQTKSSVLRVVVTFDDITDLLAAEQAEAWKDVARRIAHEIKNPLTPIQLSAERLKRKYGHQIVENYESFEGCIDTICRQVFSIGNLIDEFSLFARLPSPSFRKENLNKLLKESVLLFQDIDPLVTISFQSEWEDIFVECDARLISQVMNNLLKNAVESIFDKRKEVTLTGQVIVKLIKHSEHTVMVKVTDNGMGIKNKKTETLITPYVTTKKGGSGLGLAIVKRIIKDHSGDFEMGAGENDGVDAHFTLPYWKEGGR